MIEKIGDNLKEHNPFSVGDSEGKYKEKLDKFYQDLDDMRSGKRKFTMILDDCFENSFVQNPFYPEKDENVEVKLYERS